MLGPNRWREMMFRYNPLTHKNVRLSHNLAAWTLWAGSNNSLHEDVVDHLLAESGIDALSPPREQANFISSRRHMIPRYYGNIFRDEAPLSDVVFHNTSQDQFISWQEVLSKWNSSSQVLRFHSLYDIQVNLQPQDQSVYQQTFREIFKDADLKQF